MGTWLYWNSTKSPNESGVVIVIGLIGAVAAAVAYTALTKATRVADAWLINWAVCLVGLPVSLLANTKGWYIPSGEALLILLVIGVGTLLSQYLLIISFARLPLPLATALTPSSIIWSVVGDALATGIGELIQAIVASIIYTFGIFLLVFDKSAERRSNFHLPN